MARPGLSVLTPGRVPDNPRAAGVRPPDHTRGREPYLGLRLAEVVPRSRPLRQGGGGHMAVQRVVRREAANSSAPQLNQHVENKKWPPQTNPSMM